MTLEFNLINGVPARAYPKPMPTGGIICCDYRGFLWWVSPENIESLYVLKRDYVIWYYEGEIHREDGAQ